MASVFAGSGSMPFSDTTWPRILEFNSKFTFAVIELKVVLTTSIENVADALDKFSHSVGVNNNLIDRNADTFDAKQDLFHHFLKGFACITETEGSPLKPIPTTWRNERGNVPRLFS